MERRRPAVARGVRMRETDGAQAARRRAMRVAGNGRAREREGRFAQHVRTRTRALSRSAATAGSLDLMTVLLDAGAAVNRKDANGCTALAAAAFSMQEGSEPANQRTSEPARHQVN
eukprot:7254039-Prymnesium_polylepis.2